MKPIPSTIETRRQAVIASCKHGIANPEPNWVPSVLPRLRAAVSLGDDASAEAIVEAQKAAGHWSDLQMVVTCDGCGQEVAEVVKVGQEPDYESSTAELCRACLLEALAALDAAPR